MEIGSIYEISPQETDGEKAYGISAVCFPRLGEISKYGKKYETYTASGREAIALCLKSLEKERPDLPRRCLLPAYMCDTVFSPFERAGWEISFYSLEKNLTADADRLTGQVNRTRPGLLFIHPYYGVDTWKPVRPLLKEWREKGLCVMEDVTQSYYLQGAGREADYAVGSLRKWYRVPDGGFAVSDSPFPEQILSSGEAFAAERLSVLTRKWEYLHGLGDNMQDPKRKEEYLKKNWELEERLDAEKAVRGMSEITGRLLLQVDEAACRERRRRNCRLLAKGLSGVQKVVPVLPCDSREAAPLYFPVYAKDRDSLQEHLRVHDIYAPVLWPVGRANREQLSESDAYIFNHLLALPVDQRYGEKEMKRIVEVTEGA